MAIAIEEQLFQLGRYVMEVDMFPVILVGHFCLACLLIREDCQDLGTKFRQDHPFAMWLCTIITSLSGMFVWNFLFGSPLVEAAKDNTLIIIVTVLWYLVNYSPSDVVYKILTFRPVILLNSILQECLRVRFIYLGIQQTANKYPGAILIILLSAVINGNGYGLIRAVENLIRGKWAPTSNEVLQVSYFSKSGLYAGFLFYLHHLKVLNAPIELLYLGVFLTFVTFRVLITFGLVEDPLLPIESPFYSLLFGSSSDEPEEGKAEKENSEIKEKKSK